MKSKVNLLFFDTDMHPFTNYLIHKNTDITFDALYSDPFTCLGVLKLLSKSDQIQILQLLFLKDPVKRQCNDSLRELNLIKGEKAIELNSIFKSNLREMIIEPKLPQPLNTNDYASQYGQDRLNDVLQCLVTSNTTRMKPKILLLMRQSKLFSQSSITNTGFQFLLQTTTVQYWKLLEVYLNTVVAELELNLIEVIHFLFLLCLLEVNKGYDMQQLSKTQKTVIEDLSVLGLCYIDQNQFYPTRFTECLIKEISYTSVDSRFILVETNFKIYAYTSSELQKSILKLFISVRAAFKNMIAGQLTRDSVRTALDCGISADQIIDYLQSHCHTLMENELPINIKDQMHLWENERDRIKHDNGYLYSDFASAQLFINTRNYAEEIDVLIWSSDTDRYMFVKEEGHSEMRSFITTEQNNMS